MRKSGLAFHCHHNTLLEYVYDYDERVRAIKRDKPESEQALRLRFFQFIPEDKLPQKGLDTYDKAGDACDKARDAYDKARDAYNKAGAAYYKARDTYDKAGDAYDKANRVALNKLHEELCPDCPWNGTTIFTRKNENSQWY